MIHLICNLSSDYSCSLDMAIIQLYNYSIIQLFNYPLINQLRYLAKLINLIKASTDREIR